MNTKLDHDFLQPQNLFPKPLPQKTRQQKLTHQMIDKQIHSFFSECNAFYFWLSDCMWQYRKDRWWEGCKMTRVRLNLGAQVANTSLKVSGHMHRLLGHSSDQT